MKRLLAVLMTVLLAGWCWADGIKIAFRDYSLTDPGIGVLSFGVGSWTDKDSEFDIGGYFDFKFIQLFEEKLNFGIGFIAKPADERPVDLRMETSLTTHWFDCLELGAWWAPFWGCLDMDDPWGLMAGYYLKF